MGGSINKIKQNWPRVLDCLSKMMDTWAEASLDKSHHLCTCLNFSIIKCQQKKKKNVVWGHGNVKVSTK